MCGGLADEEGQPILLACREQESGSHMLNFITATKLYRRVPQQAPGQVRG